MNYSELHEDRRRGTFDFPIELYFVNKNSPRYQMPLHWHLEYELILVLEGGFSLTLDGKTAVLQAGDSAWIGDGVIHGGAPENCVYECVVFDLVTLLNDTPLCSASASEFLASENGFSGIFLKGSEEAELADRIFESMEKEQKGYEWVTIGLLWQLMGLLLKNSAGNTAAPARGRITRLKNVLTYIRNSFGEAVTLADLAAVAGMSPKYFCRAFSGFTGRTPIEYLNFYRIEYAGERLTLTDEPVTEIAFACGFDDMSYFSKTFKKYKGISPSDYRKAAKKT